MILLDTNVVSEAMKPEPNRTVRTWLNAQAVHTLYLSSVTLAELLYGVWSLPVGKRQRALNHSLNGLLLLFQHRILPFDADAAACYADLAVLAKQRGRGLSVPDGYIAAIARSRGFMVASRDTSPFQAVDLTVINPWNM